MSFLDQKPRIATTQDVEARWSGAKPGKAFRCYLCGHRFKVGDTWRFVYANHVTVEGGHFGNFFTCAQCDGDDVLDRWLKQCREAAERFWWLNPRTYE